MTAAEAIEAISPLDDRLSTVGRDADGYPIDGELQVSLTCLATSPVAWDVLIDLPPLAHDSDGDNGPDVLRTMIAARLRVTCRAILAALEGA